MHQNDISINLSSHLFWDVNAALLDAEIDKAFIIKRVLEYGLWHDWLYIKQYYSLEEIINQAKKYRELDNKALAFLVQLSGIPKEQFKCYITKQLIPQHWNF